MGVFCRVKVDVREAEYAHHSYFAGEMKTCVVSKLGDVKVGRRPVLLLLDGFFNRVKKRPISVLCWLSIS